MSDVCCKLGFCMGLVCENCTICTDPTAIHISSEIIFLHPIYISLYFIIIVIAKFLVRSLSNLLLAGEVVSVMIVQGRNFEVYEGLKCYRSKMRCSLQGIFCLSKKKVSYPMLPKLSMQSNVVNFVSVSL